MPLIGLKVFKQHDMFAAFNTRIDYNKTIAGILLGEDLAFQAKEAGSNPTTRSNFFRIGSANHILAGLPANRTDWTLTITGVCMDFEGSCR